MARYPWNRINITIPSAVSKVCVHFTSKTDTTVKNLLAENENVLKVLRSRFLQTEVRVLYDLLYNLNNSARGNKTFRVLKQVEQCVNRLKEMKLDAALQSLSDMCPNGIQRRLSMKAGEADLPSQPRLEWQCLKVLGAAQLMNCTMKRCSRAFVLSKQHMKYEFIIVNLVITSMLSRLWVIFRGILASLSVLYQQLLALRAEVALARPMPFLTDFNLPANMADFLGPSDAALLVVKPKSDLHVTGHKANKERRKARVKANHRGQLRKVQQDLGVVVQRGLVLDTSVKSSQSISSTDAKNTILPEKQHLAERKRMFQRRMRQAATFKDTASNLEEMILWCKSQKLNKTKRLLTFLRLKCWRMRGAEAAGYNVQKKLQTFKQEVRQAFCRVQGPVLKTRRHSAACRRRGCLRTRLWSLRRQFRSSKMRNNVTNGLKSKKRVSLAVQTDDWISRTIGRTTALMFNRSSTDDIDDIFALVGL
ncbi:nucleolus and neural progenitor protein [Phyllopteryx taeniolatus]|uniref:nucleolus and neural progenitor protein n=1 Tax=Phyllopteryx taeniolatus TaxID=161469 RepID=UPI002AD4545C|nr:nucleolus and neural progenitor protein [Phyllopteryx taeniolatus]